MTDYPVSHTFLVHAETAALAGRHVERYLEGNQLITYARFFVNEAEILAGRDPAFADVLERGLAANRAFGQRMLDHLHAEGVSRLDQLLDLEQGYVTKVLHTLTHLVDGFIGVDSVFYNLVEDSHRLSPALTATLQRDPGNYWLVPVRTGQVAASVLHRVD